MDSSANPQNILTIQIKDLARGGAGVARDESGRVVFVPFTAPGDQIRARIVHQEKRYAQAEIVEILKSSSERQVPPCPVFTQCGGCQWQHLPYATQWKTKSAGVRHALDRVKVPIPSQWDEFPAQRIWEYRNRIQLRGFGEEIGYFAARSHDLVPIQSCAIARPEINAELEKTRQEGKLLARPYKVELEILPSGQVRKTWNSAHGAAGFRQIHDDQNEKLREWVAAVLLPQRAGADLLDLYGGSGNLSLPLASHMGTVHCVDSSAPAVRPEYTPANFQFHRSAVLPWILRKVKTLSSATPTRATAAILDPPRMGLGKDFVEIAAGLEAMGVETLIAVGCDPDSWARDICRFVKRGWKLTRAGALDFFPQTPHSEAVGLLVR